MASSCFHSCIVEKMTFSCLCAGISPLKFFRAWGISLLLIGVVVSNRFAHYSITGVYMNFLTNESDAPLFAAAIAVSFKGAFTSLFSIVGATYATQATSGRYSTIRLSLLPFIIGLGLFAVVASDKFHSKGTMISLFSMSLLLTSMGEGMQMLTVFDYGYEQFKYEMGDEEKAKWHAHKWWDGGRLVGTASGLVFYSLFESPNSLHWWMYGGIFSAGFSVVTSLICILGQLCFHTEGVGVKNPILDVLKVVVAAIRKRHLPYATDAVIYTEDKRVSNESAQEKTSNTAEKMETIQTTKEGDQIVVMDHRNQLEREGLDDVHEHSHNHKLRWLIKASIIESPALVDLHVKQWRLCSSNKVKDAQMVLGFLPLWSTFLMFQVVRATGKTFFLKQGFHMKQTNISVAILLVFQNGSELFITYLFLPLLKRVIKYKNGIPPLFRIGLGLLLSVCCCIVAGMVERWRKRGPTLLIFWLFPQCFLLGAAIGLADDGISDFFDSAVPSNLRVCYRLTSESVKGVGLLINSVILAAIYSFSIPLREESWIDDDKDNLRTANVDYLYFIIAGISTVNLLLYFFVSRKYNQQPFIPANRTQDQISSGSSDQNDDDPDDHTIKTTIANESIYI